jgi:hypothetical protein
MLSNLKPKNDQPASSPASKSASADAKKDAPKKSFNLFGEGLATVKDYQEFSEIIKKYDYAMNPSIKTEVNQVNNKFKQVKINNEDINRLNAIEIPGLKKDVLNNLSEKITKECKLAATEIKYAYIKIVYINGDSPEISVDNISEKPINIKCGQDYTAKLPLGIYVVGINAKYKESLKSVYFALIENETSEVYVMTDKNGSVFYYMGNVWTLPTATGLLGVLTSKSGVSFTLESEWLLVKEEKDQSQELKKDNLDIEKMTKLKESNPGVYNLLSSKEIECPKNSKIFYKLIKANDGSKKVILPSPITLSVPAGEYKVNGKNVIVEGDTYNQINLDEPEK